MYKLPIVLIGIISLAGCEKYITSRSEIQIGEYQNMTVNFYDTTLTGGYYSPAVLNLDLDNDGTDDIQFESWIQGSPGMGQIPESMIRCLHPHVALSGCFTSDTLFLYREIYVSEEGDGTFKKYLYHDYTCHRMSDTDSVVRVSPAFKIVPFDRGDHINSDGAFHTDTICLAAHWYSYPPVYVANAGDTVIWLYKTFSNDCNEFPMDKIKFIGLKMDDRLGWIKLSIFDWYRVMIHESGIQE